MDGHCIIFPTLEIILLVLFTRFKVKYKMRLKCFKLCFKTVNCCQYFINIYYKYNMICVQQTAYCYHESCLYSICELNIKNIFCIKLKYEYELDLKTLTFDLNISEY